MDEFEFALEGTFGWEITLEKVTEMLREANGAPLLIKVSSSGGQVEVASAIKNSLEQYKMEHNVSITFDLIGWAQSAGSYVAMIEGTKRIAHPDTLFMYHNPSTCACGDYRELARTSDTLSALTRAYVAAYSNISGKSEVLVATEMENETFLVGQEIVDNGFADEMFNSGEQAQPVALNKDMICMLAKDKFEEVANTLKVAAFGGNEVTHINQKQKNIENKTMEATNMGDQNNTENTPQEPTVDHGARAEAFAAAMKALPEQGDDLLKDFQAGKDASYFEGMVKLASNMQAKKDAESADQNLETAGSESPEPVGGEDAGQGNVVMKVKTAGITGKTFEVK